MRLFAAILLPAPIKEQLLQAQELLRAHGSGNFTRFENLHLTLAFLGETQQEEAAIQAIRNTDSASFLLQFSQPGNFDNLYWAGITLSPALSALQERLVRNLSAQGFSLESRQYVPHITLCRNYQPVGNLPLAEIKELLQPLSFAVDRINLMESTHNNGQLLYCQRFQKELL